MSILRKDNPMSGSSSVASNSSSSMEPLPPNKYLMKTLCFSKKSMTMPSKEDYATLLSCGLGARKWQVSLDLDAETFRCALLNIYPRLSNVSGYSLWTLRKDKTFEKLPQKVNTPNRIRAYLGSQFTGCLIIMPSEEISLGPSPTKTLRPDAPANKANAGKDSHKMPRDKNGRFRSSYDGYGLSPFHLGNSQTSHSHHSLSWSSPMRQFCLVCGRTAKPNHAGTTAYYNVESKLLGNDNEDEGIPISTALKSILRLELPKKKIVPSEEICKKCFRQLNEIRYLELQLNKARDDVANNFFHTINNFRKLMHPETGPSLIYPQQSQQYPPSFHAPTGAGAIDLSQFGGAIGLHPRLLFSHHPAYDAAAAAAAAATTAASNGILNPDLAQAMGMAAVPVKLGFLEKPTAQYSSQSEKYKGRNNDQRPHSNEDDELEHEEQHSNNDEEEAKEEDLTINSQPSSCVEDDYDLSESSRNTSSRDEQQSKGLSSFAKELSYSRHPFKKRYRVEMDHHSRKLTLDAVEPVPAKVARIDKGAGSSGGDSGNGGSDEDSSPSCEDATDGNSDKKDPEFTSLTQRVNV